MVVWLDQLFEPFLYDIIQYNAFGYHLFHAFEAS